MALTDLAVSKAKAKAKKYKLHDERGLFLLVKPNGSKLWRYKYRFDGVKPETGKRGRVEKLISLGDYDDNVSLRQARKRRDEARALLDEGIDPAAQRRLDKLAAELASVNTFKAIAREWMALNERKWSKGHAGRVLRRLEGDVFPDIGPRPIHEITPRELLAVLRKVERRSADVAHKLQQYVSAIFRYAVGTGRVASDPARDLRGVLTPVDRTKHFAALTEADLPDFLTKLDAYDGHPMTKIAINLLMLTACRSIELRGAKWGEVDLEKAEWRVPAARMKQRDPHVVPLSTQAVAQLRALQQISGDASHDFLFPSLGRSRDKPMSENTMLYALYRMGLHSRATCHGFRALFSTVMNESGENADWIEAALAHSPATTNKVRAAYLRSQFLPQRRGLMQRWADRLDAARAAGQKVVSIGHRKRA